MTFYCDFILQGLEQLYCILMEKDTTEADITLQKSAMERDLFKVVSYQAEAVGIMVTTVLKWGILYI